MKNVLITVDADSAARTRAAVSEAIALVAREPAQVHVLSVQPRVSSHVARFFAHEELLAHQYEAGAEEMAGALAQLEAAHVPCVSHVRVGRRAETIAETAHELHCGTILLGPPDAMAPLDHLFGSVAQQVRHMMAASADDCRVIGA